MTEPSVFWDDLNRDLRDPRVAAEFAANQAAIRAHDAAVNNEAVGFFARDPRPRLDTAALTAEVSRAIEGMRRMSETLRPVQITAGGEQVCWGEPAEDADANRPVGRASVCAHVCGASPDHTCDAKAATRLTYTLPSGGTRSMPICQPCYNSEWAARQRYTLTSEGELVRLDCKECPEALLRVALPTEESHDAIRDACAEHDRLKHPESTESANACE